MTENSGYNLEKLNDKAGLIAIGESALGGHDALDFTAEVDKFIASGLEALLLDLGKNEVMNSSGLGMMVNAHTTLKKQSKRLVLVNIPEKVRKLLKMTHLAKVFEAFDTKEEALDKIG
jgi:anti-anti-sigma factor